MDDDIYQFRMDDDEIKVFARRQDWNHAIDMRLLMKRRFGSFLAAPISFTKAIPGQHYPPAITLKNEEAQALMDELWNCGIRPSEGTGSAGSLAATESHLRDMQMISKGLLRKQGVQID